MHVCIWRSEHTMFCVKIVINSVESFMCFGSKHEQTEEPKQTNYYDEHLIQVKTQAGCRVSTISTEEASTCVYFTSSESSVASWLKNSEDVEQKTAALRSKWTQMTKTCERFLLCPFKPVGVGSAILYTTLGFRHQLRFLNIAPSTSRGHDHAWEIPNGARKERSDWTSRPHVTSGTFPGKSVLS